ncbi:Pre-rRNA-processing protein TSR1 -like protein [Sarcoptes scabiei]|uniref:Pre-rRNA-processing protein TSR1 homolog n=1 Tax=Sarcoptes scabiei TaxID=52283 RepID=A0A132AJB5_SARSC|nr:Pre-rRNA-processing protein TSR1 -like protein [Sarcoptes scabiei]KPM11076.1 pre-rRNA-processing protein TSR1-like protein [Sarcoptes scabiei]
MDHHRHGRFKQKNKPHKAGKKRSRRDSINSLGSIRSSSKRSKKDVSRLVRKNRLLQLKKLKLSKIQEPKRSSCIAPILISILDCSGDVTYIEKLFQSLDLTNSVKFSERGSLINLFISKLKTKFQICFLNPNDLYSSLDLTKISDYLLLIHSSKTKNENGHLDLKETALLDAIYNHCLPKIILADVRRPDGLHRKERSKSNVSEFLALRYPGMLSVDNQKLYSLDTTNDLIKLLYFCSSKKRQNKRNSYCHNRSQILVENFNFVPNDNDDKIGNLQVEGYVRHNALNPNSLIYISGFGEFQIDKIEAINNDHLNGTNRFTEFVISSDPLQRPDLERENPIEMIIDDSCKADSESKNTVVEKKSVPKGTSEYQAAWLVDSDNEIDDEEEDDEVDSDEEDEIINQIKKLQFAPIKMEDENEMKRSKDIDDACDEEELKGEENVDGIDFNDDTDLDEDREMLAKFREEKDYEMFPDEIDTPMEQFAKDRFRKYRGLKSFRTSTWDPEENLPADYSRIFKFKNFHAMRKKILHSSAIGIEPGFYARVHLINVPRELYNHYHQNPSKPLILFELLINEHRMSVMNIALKKLSTFTEPIRSKETLLFHVGYRRFWSQPIFSEHTIGDKHRYEKFLRNDSVCVATLYAPITYPPAPVLVYCRNDDTNQLELIAIGSLLDCSPDRLNIKRLILSGHPFKINRKHAVVRFMFFNREDILWFKPIELRTKYGRTGHIIEPIGTHGHMKCIFDRQLQSQDTVLMNLYKRIFPKWFYKPILFATNPIESS